MATTNSQKTDNGPVIRHMMQGLRAGIAETIMEKAREDTGTGALAETETKMPNWAIMKGCMEEATIMFSSMTARVHRGFKANGQMTI